MVEVGPVERAKVLQLIEEIRVSANWSGAQTDMLCEVISGEVRDLPAAPDHRCDELREALSAANYYVALYEAEHESNVALDVYTRAARLLAGKGVKG